MWATTFHRERGSLLLRSRRPVTETLTPSQGRPDVPPAAATDNDSQERDVLNNSELLDESLKTFTLVHKVQSQKY